ncbi:MAG TPA: carboxypeptidase-like regulatory domain-containing protein, partial [Candidatus Marinimicrobia bacterium]|nr:carboxypeptidase-like regulatory domain-containing protein [Candidatus Neomarinimicrobiota bacterium]
MQKNKNQFSQITLLLFFTGNIFGQNISGTVYDQDGSPLAGANVIVAGTSSGAATDVNGVFSFPFTSTG